jgi:DnaJ-class molecular chaperone
MSFQKCPVCDGSGKVHKAMGVSIVCHVCNGHGIIDEVTGKPPESSSSVNKSNVYFLDSISPPPPRDYDSTITSNGRNYTVVPPEVIAAAERDMKDMLRKITRRKKNNPIDKLDLGKDIHSLLYDREKRDE